MRTTRNSAQPLPKTRSSTDYACGRHIMKILINVLTFEELSTRNALLKAMDENKVVAQSPERSPDLPDRLTRHDSMLPTFIATISAFVIKSPTTYVYSSTLTRILSCVRPFFCTFFSSRLISCDRDPGSSLMVPPPRAVCSLVRPGHDICRLVAIYRI